jgi:hypothetical protein
MGWRQMETKPIVLQFGEGKIAVAVTDFGWVLFNRVEDGREIGSENPNAIGMTIEELDPDLIFTFSKVESVDVLIGLLRLAREQVESKAANAAGAE